MDTIEKIEKDSQEGREVEDIYVRILIQIAYQLRTLAQKGVG